MAREGVQGLLAAAEREMEADKPAEAIRTLKKLLKRDEEHLPAMELMAKALWRLAKLPELLTLLERLTTLNPYEPGYHALRGAAYQALGRTAEANAAFARSTRDASRELSSSSIRALSALNGWHSERVEDLLRQDPAFRAEFQQDPERACRQRGLPWLNSELHLMRGQAPRPS